jgi:outer membrane protein TolC
VLDAQRSLFDFDNQLALAQGQASANLVQLYQALGGGWSPAAPARDRSQP